MRTAFTTLAILGLPRLALACPVCFGQSDAPMAQAINSGVIAMLVVVAGMLGSFATFIIYLVRRASAMEETPDALPTPGAREGSDPQEGTVRC